jgi:hypothetical protein
LWHDICLLTNAAHPLLNPRAGETLLHFIPERHPLLAARADYREGSHLWLLLKQMVTETADYIMRRRDEERDNATVGAPTF